MCASEEEGRLNTINFGKVLLLGALKKEPSKEKQLNDE
jgi:hypothetical protein